MQFFIIFSMYFSFKFRSFKITKKHCFENNVPKTIRLLLHFEPGVGRIRSDWIELDRIGSTFFDPIQSNQVFETPQSNQVTPIRFFYIGLPTPILATKILIRLINENKSFKLLFEQINKNEKNITQIEIFYKKSFCMRSKICMHPPYSFCDFLSCSAKSGIIIGSEPVSTNFLYSSFFTAVSIFGH
jgi:hypothetical protein